MFRHQPGSSEGQCQDGTISLSFIDNRVHVEGEHHTLTVRLEIEGEVVGEQTFRPDYEDFYPNGKKCDKTPCHQATETMISDRPPGMGGAG